MTVSCDHAPAHAGDPVYLCGQQIGTVTSGGYGHRVQENIAYAYVDASALTGDTSKLEVGILGGRHSATLTARCMFDPQNSRVRA